MSFEKQVQDWVAVDNQIKTLGNKMKELREIKNNNETSILKYIETNKLNKATVNISDGILKFVDTKQIAPLTLKYVKECLEKCIKNTEQVDYVMNIIKESREVKYNTDIKRIYK